MFLERNQLGGSVIVDGHGVAGSGGSNANILRSSPSFPYADASTNP